MAKTPSMKAVIFAGGIGTRMWPYSRKKSPKQFEPIIDGKSTLQLTIDRIRPDFDWQDIYVSTGAAYVEIIRKQLPQIPAQNIIGEPQMRDVAPAVGYVMGILEKEAPATPVTILWSDHVVEHINVFKQALQSAAEYLHQDPNKIVFLGQKPRFANQNLGWIEFGDKIDSKNGYDFRQFISWHYRPDLPTAKKYFKDGVHAWNPGYFITTPGFIMAKYQQYAPVMYSIIRRIVDSHGQPDHIDILNQLYPTLEKTDFDSAILEHLPDHEAVVMSVEMGWSDVGTWESLKEAMQTHPQENVTQGQVHTHNANNNVIYSTTKQLVTAIDIEGMVIAVTDDAILVTRQQSIPQIKKMLKSFEGTDREKYT